MGSSETGRYACSLITDAHGRVLVTEGACPAIMDGVIGEQLPEWAADAERMHTLAELVSRPPGDPETYHATVFHVPDGTVRIMDLAIRDAGGGKRRIALAPCPDPFQLGHQLGQSDSIGEAVFHAGMGIMVTDPGGHIERVNPSFTEATGYPPEEAIGRNARFLQSGLQDAAFYRSMWAELRATGRWSGEIWNRRRSGAIYPEWLSIRAIHDGETGALRHYVGTFSDLTWQKDLEAMSERIVAGLQGRTGEAFFAELVKQASHILAADRVFVGVLREDHPDRVRTLAVFGDGQPQANFEYGLAGTPCATVVGQKACSYRDGVAARFPEDPTLQSLGIEAYAGVPLFDSHGHPLGILVALFRDPLAEDGPTEHLLRLMAARTAAEVERARQEARIQQLAYYDDVTGLPNQHLCKEHTNRQIALNRRHGSHLALLLLDLDEFKGVNDAFGHAAGDRLLYQVGQRLTDTLREADSVARLGGDEFIIVLPTFATLEAAQRAAARVADKIQSALAEPFALGDRQVLLGASTGVAFHPHDGASYDDLRQNADTALHCAKGDLACTFRFFDTEMGRLVSERMDLEEALRGAIERRELATHLQPRVDLDSMEVVGAEALVRWSHPEFGPISPGRFIPVAEGCHLIRPLSSLVMSQALHWLSQGGEAGGAGSAFRSLSVNISPPEFRREDFLPSLKAAIHEHGIDPACLELELTERILVEDPAAVARKLDAIKAMGIRISIDDFGTGYSSLAYLKDMPVDVLKIDRSFVNNLLTDRRNESIVISIADLASNLGLHVCAEGVETEEQRQRLREIIPGHTFQGFLHSRALSPEAFNRLLQPA